MAVLNINKDKDCIRITECNQRTKVKDAPNTDFILSCSVFVEGWTGPITHRLSDPRGGGHADH